MARFFKKLSVSITLLSLLQFQSVAMTLASVRGQGRDALAPKSPFADRESPQAKMVPPNVKLQPIDLETELALSGLSPDEVVLLQTRSKNVMTIYEFLKMNGSDLAGGYALGSTSPLYYAASGVAGLKNWNVAFREFGIREPNEKNMPEFLTQLVRREKPIVFFVPRDIGFHRKKYFSYTAYEFNWFLSRPDSMNNVYFVFGLQEIISANDVLHILGRMDRLMRENPSHFGDLLSGVYAHMLRNVDKYKMDAETPTSSAIPLHAKDLSPTSAQYVQGSL